MTMHKYLHPRLLAARYPLSHNTQYGHRSFGVKTNMNHVKVSILGAAGGIGQPLSLLMKMNPKVKTLALYDIVNVNGVAADLSHIDTPAEVTMHNGQSNIGSALKDSDIVIIPAGVPRKPGMTRDDLFSINSGILMSLASHVCDNAKDAFILVITNPVNSTLPIFSEVMKKNNCYNPRKLFGVSKLDNSRASTFLSQADKKPAGELKVNVVGGHSGNTIVPLISQLGLKLDQSTIEALTHRIQFAGDEVVKAKDGAGSATLSMAYSGVSFANSIIEAVVGNKNVTEVAYINHESFRELHGLDFFAAKIDINKDGISKVHDIGEVSKYESELISKAISQLKIDIEKGVSFAKSKLS